MARFTVVIDACVFHGQTLRNLFMRVSLTGLFKAHWTDRIHEEWINSVLKRRPDIQKDKLLAVRDLMDHHVKDAIVTNYELIELKLELPDAKDTHVLAAAIKCKADAIVTFNLKDFPSRILEQYEIEALHPDDFLAYQIDLSPTTICSSIREMRHSLNNPPFTAKEFLALLARNELPLTVNALKEYIECI